jgi:hypothetical protein
MERVQWVKAEWPEEVKEPVTRIEGLFPMMSRVDETWAEDRG